jgi:hypothetical protein
MWARAEVGRSHLSCGGEGRRRAQREHQDDDVYERGEAHHRFEAYQLARGRTLRLTGCVYFMHVYVSVPFVPSVPPVCAG